MSRKRVTKSAAPAVLPGQLPMFPNERLVDMPLVKGKTAPCSLHVSGTDAYLELRNLEAPLIWKLALVRPTPLAKSAKPVDLLDSFGAYGGRLLRPLAAPFEVDASPGTELPGPVVKVGNGVAEYGLQTDDDHEYFFSKFGDLVGIVRIKRREDGSWSAGMSKSNVPRVLTDEAVRDGLMPPPGHSGLPKSLERVVPVEYRYWTTQSDTAKEMRDALVEASFFNDDCVKAVDGELRKVEVKYFLYDPPGDVGVKTARAKPVTFVQKVTSLIPERFLGKGYNPLVDGDTEHDWLDRLDIGDAPGALAVLSAPSTDFNPRELARSVGALKADWLIDCDDTEATRGALSGIASELGYVFKIRGEPGRLLASSFVPARLDLVEWVAKAQWSKRGTQKAVAKTVTFQGITIKVDRPKGFVQKGKDENGQPWERTYLCDYGYLPRTKGGDGDGLDVFVGDDAESSRVFWVTQKKADGNFDEYKLFVGFATPRDALKCYSDHIPQQFYSGMVEMNVEQLKALMNVEPSVELLKTVIEVVSKPFAGYDDFAACVAEQVANGKSEDAARRICGSLQAETEKTITKVVKAGDGVDERYVLGIVLEPDIVDAQSDTYSVEEIRQAEHKFMQSYRNMGLMHKEFVNEDVKILESYLAPVDFTLGDVTVKKGTWLMAVRVLDDTLWKQVKGGGLTGFSIGGSAVRKPVAEV